MFDTYFTGINTRDFAQAASVYDPAGVVDPGNPDEVARFSHYVGTTTDSEVVVRSIDVDTSGSGSLIVVTTFTSTQAAGFGPAGSTNETCTHWTVTYILSQTVAGEYRILRGSGSHQPC